MSYSEIFSDLSAHFVRGMMVHSQLATYYDFLSMRGFKRYHEFQFKHDSCSYRKLNRFYVNHYNKMIGEKSVNDPEIIPDSWYRYSREEVDVETKKTAVKNGIAEWIKWETTTLSKLQKAHLELYDDGEVSSAMLIGEFIKDVQKELKCAKRMYLDLSAVEFDLGYILDKQKKIHDKYKSML